MTQNLIRKHLRLSVRGDFSSHTKNTLCLVGIFPIVEGSRNAYHFVGVYLHTHSSRIGRSFSLFLPFISGKEQASIMSCGLLNSSQEVKRVLGYQMLSKTGKARTFKLRFKIYLSEWYFHGPNPRECQWWCYCCSELQGHAPQHPSLFVHLRYSLSVFTDSYSITVSV